MKSFIDQTPRRRHGFAYVTTAMILGLALAPVAALGAAQVSGTQEAVSVDAQNSSIKEILATLRQKFNVHVQSTANLEKQITGTYEGSLRQVLARLLEGYNFVLRTREGQMVVTVFGSGAPSGETAPATMASNTAVPSQPPAQGAQAPQAQPAAAVVPSSAAGSVNAAQAPSPSGPTPTFMVAEGPGPVPQPSGSNNEGPVIGPATSTMPSPTPAPAGSGVTLPMPTAGSPFPGITASTSPPPPAPNQPSTPSAPTPQKQ